MLSIVVIVVFFVSSSGAVSLNEFFPYGPETNDSNVELYDITGSHLHLPYVFPFFGNFYRELWIKNNGLFSFIEPGYEFYDLQPFSTLNDSCFLAGYWHQTYGGEPDGMWDKVYYQIYQNSSLSNSTMNVFRKVSDYVGNYFPQQRPFKPKMIIVSTWYYISLEIMYYVTAAGMNATLETRRFNNTFQIVLSTDEDRSFIFYLYHDLQWSDPYQYNSHARAGFHCSERNISQTLPYSGTRNIVKLMNESNVHVPGLFAFRVDTDKINHGGCFENGLTLSFHPRMGGQLGSTALSIYGPCFTNQTKIKCRFNSTEIISGTVIDKFRGVCLTPFTSMHGSVPVSISLNDGQTFISAGTFTYIGLST